MALGTFLTQGADAAGMTKQQAIAACYAEMSATHSYHAEAEKAACVQRKMKGG
jgi:hypothetical protein